MDANNAVQIRREKKKFIVDGNPVVGKPDVEAIKADMQGKADAIQWPQECANCGGPVQKTETVVDTTLVDGTGAVKKSFAVTVKGIPYCDVCYPKIKNSKNITFWQIVATFVIGVVLSIILVTYAGNNPISINMGSGLTVESVPCGALIIMSFVIGYAISWLVLKLPAILLMKDKIAKPVTVGVTDTTVKGSRSFTLGVSIPNDEYAAKFAQLNGVK